MDLKYFNSFAYHMIKYIYNIYKIYELYNYKFRYLIINMYMIGKRINTWLWMIFIYYDNYPNKTGPN